MINVSLHKNLLQSLLPPVSYDPGAPGILKNTLIDGQALDRVFADSAIPLAGLTPFQSDPWFLAYEQIYGLPGPCFDQEQNHNKRVIQLAVALKERRGISKEYYFWLAKVCGYEIVIDEYSPFTAGSYAGKPLYKDTWKYAWIVRTTATPATCFSAGRSSSGDALRSWGNELFECLFKELSPAHTIVHFAYGS